MDFNSMLEEIFQYNLYMEPTKLKFESFFPSKDLYNCNLVDYKGIQIITIINLSHTHLSRSFYVLPGLPDKLQKFKPSYIKRSNHKDSELNS